MADTWEEGSRYERYIGRWSRQVAPEFLGWLGASAGLRWLDVGCGTGALCAAIRDRCAPSSVVGVEPSEGFRDEARTRLGAGVTVVAGSATGIPLPDRSVDVTVSGLVLNFVADSGAALGEMRRVTREGGAIAAYVWDYADKMEYLRIFWDAAAAVDSEARGLDEGVRFPLCRPEALRRLLESAELDQVEVGTIDVPARFKDFEDYWEPFLGGQGPAPTYVKSLEEDDRDRLRETVRERLPRANDGTISLVARAWAVRGRV